VTPTKPSKRRVVFVCRSPACRTQVEALIGAAETYPSAVDACLSVARRPAGAVIVNLEDIEGSERDIVAAMRRAQLGLRIYTIVKPEDEPCGRRLLRAGVADYFVLPGDIRRLPQALSAECGVRSAD
jgi:DNA-binding NarL/FixJ family response regulator